MPITIGNIMTMQRLTATISSVAERVHATRDRPSIPARDATLAGLALSPRTILDLPDEATAAVEAVVSARFSAQQPAVR